jgi:hypothetical protein
MLSCIYKQTPHNRWTTQQTLYLVLTKQSLAIIKREKL